MLGVGRESPHVLYLRLRGEVAHDRPDGELALEAGKLAEDGLFRPLLASRHGLTGLERLAPRQLPEDPEIGTSFDFWHPATKTLIECKVTAGGHGLWGSREARSVPAHVVAQCQFQWVFVPEAKRFLVAVLILPHWEFHLLEVPEDRQVGDELVKRAMQFMHGVRHGIPPAVVDEASARLLLQGKAGKTVQDAALTDKLVELAALQGTVKGLEARIKEIRDQVIPMIGDAEIVLGHDGREIATYKQDRVWDAELFQALYPQEAAACMKAVLDKDAIRKQHPDKYAAALRAARDPREAPRKLTIKGIDR